MVVAVAPAVNMITALSWVDIDRTGVVGAAVVANLVRNIRVDKVEPEGVILTFQPWLKEKAMRVAAETRVAMNATVKSTILTPPAARAVPVGEREIHGANVLSAQPVNIKARTRTLRPVARLVLQGNIPRVPVPDRVQHALPVNSTVVRVQRPVSDVTMVNT
jgi:hypothetical protein